jgi:hypothetical protein
VTRRRFPVARSIRAISVGFVLLAHSLIAFAGPEPASAKWNGKCASKAPASATEGFLCPGDGGDKSAYQVADGKLSFVVRWIPQKGSRAAASPRHTFPVTVTLHDLTPQEVSDTGEQDVSEVTKLGAIPCFVA